MKKYIKVKKEKWSDPHQAVLDKKTGQWKPAYPELYEPNFIERIKHDVLGKHFTFGQPYCVVCGLSDRFIKE